MKPTAVLKLIACISLASLAFSAAPLTAQTQEQLDQALKLAPDADADRDGKLTRGELLNYQARQEKAKSLKEVAGRVKLIEDVEYASVNGKSLKLDLYLPKTQDAERKPPLVVWVHGGGWHEYSKDRCLIIWLASEGYAVASVQYRLAPEQAIFPAQIHDCKGAVRWLRAHAKEYGYDTTRVGASGESAGGHLSLLLGASAQVTALEGDIGGNTDQPSRVDAVVNFYGPSDLLAIGQEIRKPDFLAFLFGGPVSQTREKHVAASPTSYVTAGDAPILTLHGENDPLVLPSQSRKMQELYVQAGLDYTLHAIKGVGHGGPEFNDPERRAIIKAFFDKHLKSDGSSRNK